MKYEIDNNIPIYIQLVEKIKRDIISGKISSCERLLSVRELAIKNKVNPNTIQKALNELESEGLIYTERTNGKYVTKDESLIKKMKEREAFILTERYFNNMNILGFEKEKIINYLEKYKGE